MRQNFEPEIWGPKAWFFLESVAMAYSTEPTYEEKKAADNFFSSLKYMIPCEKCRNNYEKHLKIYPLTDKVLSSRDNLFMWIVNMHNSVNKNKTRSYDETFKYYMKEYGSIEYDDDFKEKSVMYNIFTFLIIFTFIFIIIFLSYQIYLSL